MNGIRINDLTRRPFGSTLKATIIGGVLCALSAPAMSKYADTGGIEATRRAQRFTMMPMTRGVVVKVNRSTGRILIAHDRNEDVDLSASTTEFRILLRDLPPNIEDGVSIYFIAARIGPTLMVTRLESRKPD